MYSRTRQAGFSAVELVIILVIVGVIGFVGYTVYNRQNTKTADSTSTEQVAAESPKATDVPAAPAAIESTSDLDKAAALLDQVNPGDSDAADTGQLDSQLAQF